jgi:hypothetical protein
MFPFDKVKIDESFVHAMIDDPRALAIVRSVIGLGRGLAMPVVAEGVETEAQLEALRALGCDQVQGHWISRPGPIANFEGVVMDGEPDRRWCASKRASLGFPDAGEVDDLDPGAIRSRSRLSLSKPSPFASLPRSGGRGTARRVVEGWKAGRQEVRARSVSPFGLSLSKPSPLPCPKGRKALRQAQGERLGGAGGERWGATVGGERVGGANVGLVARARARGCGRRIGRGPLPVRAELVEALSLSLSEGKESPSTGSGRTVWGGNGWGGRTVGRANGGGLTLGLVAGARARGCGRRIGRGPLPVRAELVEALSLVLVGREGKPFDRLRANGGGDGGGAVRVGG